MNRKFLQILLGWGFVVSLLLSVVFYVVYSDVEDAVSRQGTTYVSIINRFVLTNFSMFWAISLTFSGFFALICIIATIWIDGENKNELL